MNTKNTKTAIIILLAAANIFFIYNIFRLKISAENIPPEMIENAVSVLARGGLAADKAKIPAKKPAYFIYEGEYSETAQEDIVKSFSGVTGGGPDEPDEIVKMYVPAGISYAAGDYRFIFSDIINSFESDYFRISIYVGALEPSKTEDEPRGPGVADDKLLAGNIKKTEKIIRDFIGKYKRQDARLDFVITEAEEAKISGVEHKYIRINQTIDGELVDSHAAYIEIRDDEVLYFSGRWYFGELTVAARKTPLLDSVNILFKSMETDKNIISGDRLKNMGAEYTVITHEMARFYLAPSWRLEFESGLALSYNMITGNKN